MDLYPRLQGLLEATGLRFRDEFLHGLCNDLRDNGEVRVLLTQQRFKAEDVESLSPNDLVTLSEEWQIRREMDELNSILSAMFSGSDSWVQSTYIQRRVHLACSNKVRKDEDHYYRVLSTNLLVVDLIRLLGRISGEIQGILEDEQLELMLDIVADSPTFLEVLPGEDFNSVNADLIAAISKGNKREIYRISVLNQLDMKDLLHLVAMTHTPPDRIGR